MNAPERPISLEELKKKRVPLTNYYKNSQDKLSLSEKIAVSISDKIGTFGFFIVLLLWTILWLLWNTFAPAGMRFDPFPGFVLWLFISNMLQLFLLPLLMISENIQNKVFQERAMADFHVNVRAERELEAVLQHLEYLEKKVEELSTRG